MPAPCLDSCTTLSHDARCPNRVDLIPSPPLVDLNSYVEGMGVSVTLVFADESHREVFLRAQGLATRADYQQRRRAQNLFYTIRALDGNGRPI